MRHFQHCRRLPAAGSIDVMEKVNLAREAARLTEFWSQRVLASGNGNLFKVAKGIGSTNWHSHDDQDEVFLVIEGRVTIQMRDRDVDLRPGDLFVVPRGTEHCPIAHEEARFLLVGPEVTSNAAGGKPDWSRTGARLSRASDPLVRPLPTRPRRRC
jgi:mannose-6-phosphate isomerase-like protein (cupin superfamily)